MKKTAVKETGSLFGSEPELAAPPKDKAVPSSKSKPAKAKPAAKPKVQGGHTGTALAVAPQNPPSGGSKVARSPRAEPSLMQIIAEASKNPLVDIGKMKELLAIKREIEREEAEARFNAELLAARAEMPDIVKDRDVEGKYKYATLEKVSTEIDHIARRYGFVMSFGTADSPIANHYRIVCDLSHRGGLSRHFFVDLPIDDVGAKGNRNKTAVQGIGSTMSYGRRYLKVLMFDLNIAGEDTDGRRRAGPAPVEIEVLTTEQAEKIIDLCEAEGCPTELFVRTMNKDRQQGTPAAANVAELPRAGFDDYVRRIQLYGKNKRDREAEAAASRGGK